MSNVAAKKSVKVRQATADWCGVAEREWSAHDDRLIKEMVDIFRPLLMARQRKNRISATTDAEHSIDARKVLTSHHNFVLGERTTVSDKKLVQKANIRGIFFPFMTSYKIWWTITAVGAILTAFLAPFQIAFQDKPGTFSGQAGVIDIALNSIFALDILVNFNLAFHNSEGMVFERNKIFRAYLSRMFWVDLIGVFPFETFALFMAGESQGNTALLCSLFRLLRFVRLHRMKQFSDMLQHNARVSLLWFTLIRNFLAVMFTTHVEACAMYFLARLHNFDENTWLGPMADDATEYERYVTSLYWSVVTFGTVGYGDEVPLNSTERVWGMCFMLFNIVVAAWIIGSITLLVVKSDEKTGDYRDTLQTLYQYSQMHKFDNQFASSLRTQLRLEFENREIADEQVLKHFPSAVRRKVLRKLYLEPLVKTKLMEGIRQQFVDAFLSSCTVEIFSPGEVIVERGSILSDLFLLVGGIAEITTHDVRGETDHAANNSDKTDDETMRNRQLEAGDFIGEIGFFTESPQVDSVSCLTVCKTLTMSQSMYKLLAQDHPGSVGKILRNLLAKVEEMQVKLPRDLAILRAGSMYDVESGYGSVSSIRNEEEEEDDDLPDEIIRRQEALTAIKDLVEMHLSKQRDNQTTIFCFAASRGDTATIRLMCDQGFSPDNADYDSRTALMVASMKGNTEVVKMLLEYHANPNLADMHGSTALLEAVKNGHEAVMTLLFQYQAKLCMSDYLAASVLCQAVFDGDMLLLRRLLRAGIQVDAADYDKRTAAHIAAAEGNVAAIRVLADHGADLGLQDRWGNMVQHEAERSNARQLLEYLEARKEQKG